MEMISVTVKILDREYKLTSAKSDETAVRKAAALIDSQARIFKKNLEHRDGQDLLAMVAITQVTDLIKTKDSFKYKDNELIEKLKDIDNLLENNLHPTQNSL